MTEEKLIQTIKSEHPESPLLVAFIQLIEETRDDEVTNVIASNISNEGRQYNAGRAAAITDLLMEIKDIRG